MIIDRRQSAYVGEGAPYSRHENTQAPTRELQESKVPQPAQNKWQ